MQGGQWSVTAIVTMAIVGALFVFTMAIYALYEYVLLAKLK